MVRVDAAAAGALESYSYLSSLARLMLMACLAWAHAHISTAASTSALARLLALSKKKEFLVLELGVSQLIEVFLVEENLVTAIGFLKAVEIGICLTQVLLEYLPLKLFKFVPGTHFSRALLLAQRLLSYFILPQDLPSIFVISLYR